MTTEADKTGIGLLITKLLAIVIFVPFIVLVTCSPIFRGFGIGKYFFWLSIPVSAWLGFYFTKESKGFVLALLGAFVIVALVLFLSWFLIANIFGE